MSVVQPSDSLGRVDKHLYLKSLSTYFLVTFPRSDPNDGITARCCALMSPEETVAVLIQ